MKKYQYRYESEFVCPQCGKVFICNIHSGRVYCSQECRVAAHKPTETIEEKYTRMVEKANASWGRISSIAAEGKRRGLSYGQEMARRKDNGG